MTWYLNDKINTHTHTEIALWESALFTHSASGSDFILTPIPSKPHVPLNPKELPERGEHINDNILQIALCQSVFIASILKLHFVKGHLKSYISFVTSQQWSSNKGIYPLFQ